MSDFYQRTALCIRHAITLCMTARGQSTTFLVKAVITSAPRNESEISSNVWREKSTCWKMLVEGNIKQLHFWAQQDFDAAAAFWLQIFPFLPTATQEGIIAQINEGEDLFATGTRPIEHPAEHKVLDPIPEESRQIVAFPFAKVKPSECVNFRDGVFQLKLEAAKLLNDVAAGTQELNPTNERAIQRVNELCQEVGLTPLDYEPRA